MKTTADLSISPRHIELFPLRAPLPAPRVTPFGRQFGPQTLLVRITDDQGASGWGEAWGTFPSGFGIEHRAALIETVLAPLLNERSYDGPAEAFAHLTAATRLLANHTGEFGPVAQAIAGIDIALWDLVARRADQPLWRLLGASHGRVPAYASGLDPAGVSDRLPEIRRQGFSALKVRLWGGDAAHGATLRRLREDIDPAIGLLADANQSWDVAQAVHQLQSFQDIPLGWIEEPIPADLPDEDWRRIRSVAPVPISGGENVRGEEGFAHALALGALSVVQPDICKWGGFSGCLPLARRIIAAGRGYCPHFLGGGVGLLASAHLLAAAGGDGLLEHDVNDNPLRQRLVAVPPVTGGTMTLPDIPGWGGEPDMGAIIEFRIKPYSR